MTDRQPTTAALDFRLLGPLEVWRNGRLLRLGGARQRALLALLLVHRGETLSSELLVDQLFGGTPSETATNALQAAVSRLRRVLEDGDAKRVLVTRAPGYALQIAHDQVDLNRFQRLVVQGRKALSGGDPLLASVRLREALALWRGEPLADLGDIGFADRERRRLVELRLGAVMERIDADLAVGGHAELIGELEVLIAEHPFAERLHAQLMLALYRSGRQTEALEAYRAARDALVDALGIEPGADLRRLQLRILNQDSALDLVAQPTSAAAVRGVFVGREHELSELASCLDDAVAGQGRLCLLTGEPGIGKSRLAEELCARARARGAAILAGRCWEAGGAPAFWPWVQALRGYIEETEPTLVRAQLGTGAEDLAQLLPELHELLPDLGQRWRLEPESARFQLFRAVASFVGRAAERRALVLVLDDLHAADEPSLLLLQFVAREVGHRRILVVGAYRDVDPTVREPLSASIAALVREPVTRTLHLRGLPGPDVARFIERVSGEAPAAEFLAAVQEETEGNPLFVGEIVRLVAAEGPLDAARITIPESIRAVIARRLRQLSEECTRLLVLASVLGREFPLDLLARLGNVSYDELLDRMDEAVAARVLADVSGSHDRLRFTHVLVRDTLYDGLTAAHRVRLHRLAVEALEELYGDDPRYRLAELAHHAIAGSDFERGFVYARRAGDRASELLGFEEAARLYQTALAAGEHTDVTDDERCELLILLGDVQARAGDMPEARRSFLHAADLARALGSADALARAALGYGGRFLFTRAIEDQRFVPLLQQAADALGPQDNALRVRVLTRLANAQSQNAPAASDALTAEAITIAEGLNDPATLAYATAGRLWATRAPTDLDNRLALARDLIATGDKERAFDGYNLQHFVLIARGEIARLHQEFATQTRLADELGQPAQHWWIAAHRAQLALLQGRLAEAAELIQHSYTLGGRAQSYDAPAYFQIQRFALYREQGRLAEILTDLEHTAQSDPARPLLQCVLTVAQMEVGQVERARRVFDGLAADNFSLLHVNNDWLLSAALLAEFAAATNDANHAEILYHRLSEFDGLNVDTAEVSTGAVSRYLGLLATATGDLAMAERHFQHAITMNTHMDASPWLVHTQHDLATMLHRRGAPGDAEAAEELLRASRQIAEAVGMKPLVRRVVAIGTPFAHPPA